MIYDAEGYARKYKIKGKVVNSRTIKRLANKGLLPSHTICHKLKGSWIFEVPDKWPEHIRDKFDIMIKAKSKPKSQ